MKLRKTLFTFLFPVLFLVFNSTILKNNVFLDIHANSEKIVFVDVNSTHSWWETNDIFIRQSHTANGTASWNDTRMTNVQSKVYFGTLNAASTGFEFFVYNTGSPQNKSTFFSGEVITNIKADIQNYFSINVANSNVEQSGIWSAGHPTETYILSKHLPGYSGRTLDEGTFTKYTPTLPSLTAPNITGYQFIDWYFTTNYLLSYSSLKPNDLGVNRTVFAKLIPIYNDETLRIPVVRPGDTRFGYINWADGGAYQVLRVADTQEDLTNNVNANITIFEFTNYTSDTYYDKSIFGDNTFNEYDADGIIFYNVPIVEIVGKYFDLVRYNPNDVLGTPWTKTSSYLFTNGLANGIFRIFGNGQGIVFPTGITSESRLISDSALSEILYGYLTCNDSINNGYQAFKTLNENYNLLDRSSSTTTLLDYDHTNFTNYESSRDGITTTTLGNKITRMQTQYNSANPSAPINSQRNLTYQIDLQTDNFILMSTLVLTLSIAGLYIKKSLKRY